MKSVCCFTWRGFEDFDLLVKRISKYFRHFIVKAKPGNNGRLGSKFAIGASASAVRGQAYNVLTAPITACGNAVDHQFAAVSQIDNERLIGALYGQDYPSPAKSKSYDLSGQKWSRS